MYQQLAIKLFIAGGAEIAYSRAVSIAHGNSVLMEVTTFTGAAVDIQAQESNDLQNWSNVGDPLSLPADVGYASREVSGVSSIYVRLMYTSGDMDVVLGSGLSVAAL